MHEEENLDPYTAIFDYLSANFYSIDSCEFVKDAINALVNNNCTINTELLDEQITTDLPPCLTDLVNDLKSLQNGKFGRIIAQFAGSNPVPLNYNWMIKTGSAPGFAAFTSPVIQPGNTAVTTINSNLITVSTDLSLARTIIHESFHAYLISIYRFRNIDMSYSNLVNEYYAQFDHNLNDTHHHIFTISTIINEVVAALSEYGVSKGYNLPAQFYQDMAWGGLLGTDAYNNLPQYQRDRIASTIASEQNNNNNNAHGISPKGHTICY